MTKVQLHMLLKEATEEEVDLEDEEEAKMDKDKMMTHWVMDCRQRKSIPQ